MTLYFYETYCNNFVVDKKHIENGECHNPNGPAHEQWDEITHNKTLEKYYINDRPHRIGAPAVIKWDTDGIKNIEFYYINGGAHNENGPAVISYNNSGNILYKSYYIDDYKVTEEEYYQKYPNAAGNPEGIKNLVEDICSKCGDKDDYLSPHKNTGKLVCYKCCV